jgi:hypothetical protein
VVEGCDLISCDTNDGQAIYISLAYFPVQPMISLQSCKDIPLCASIVSLDQDVCSIHFALSCSSSISTQLVRDGLRICNVIEIELHGSWRAYGFVSLQGVEINGCITYEIFGLFFDVVNHTNQIISRQFYLGISEVPDPRSSLAETADFPCASGVLSFKLTVSPGSWWSVMTDGCRRRVEPPLAVSCSWYVQSSCS